MAPKITKKKDNPNRRNGRLNSRANNDEMHKILKKALYYDGGDLSKYIRRACLGYDKPKEKRLP